MRAINPPCSHTQSFFLPPPALALFKAPRQHSSAPRMNEVAFTTGCLQPRCIGGDNWAPLSRRAFDLSLKTDVALLCLFQYALPSMGDAKGRRHLVIITQWFELANPTPALFYIKGPAYQSCRDGIWGTACDSEAGEVLGSLLFPFCSGTAHLKTCCFNISRIKMSFNQRPDHYGCQDFFV